MLESGNEKKEKKRIKKSTFGKKNYIPIEKINNIRMRPFSCLISRLITIYRDLFGIIFSFLGNMEIVDNNANFVLGLNIRSKCNVWLGTCELSFCIFSLAPSLSLSVCLFSSLPLSFPNPTIIWKSIQAENQFVYNQCCTCTQFTQD